jgi:hypothetical protein
VCEPFYRKEQKKAHNLEIHLPSGLDNLVFADCEDEMDESRVEGSSCNSDRTSLALVATSLTALTRTLGHYSSG